MYAVTVTFYEEMKERMIESAKKAMENMYSGVWKPTWPEKPKIFYCTKSVCILSYYPFFRRFRECLKEIYRVACSPGKIPIEVGFYSFFFFFFFWYYYCLGPQSFSLLDVDLERIFGCLSLDNVILIFRGLLTQMYKIVLTSNYVSIITEICEGLISFLRPFEWQFTC
ncbi:hypothetical protein RFI_28021 [Reticulomyxa filosa]|uniref:UDENN domain-containing protein n=1 Tax=Reticulomyxa filosa TaxID=46433 RepID=X6M6W1_RETFI|nr:hypothetical protein RFI_28021 [Reticulomyxa filosa]|eukprot:ETO09356.1 hypothetical protein RFI_28021 [Reticulomyxa filosa]